MTLVIVAGVIFGFATGWAISKAVNTSKRHETGRVCVYFSKTRGKVLCRLSQPYYLDQRRVMVYGVQDGNGQRHNLDFSATADEIRFYTVEGEVINEANWVTV
jgi:hypothetical protein